MGDPRKSRRKYDKPLMPWEDTRLKEERIIVDEYGLKNKKELWKFSTMLRKIKEQAKNLIATQDEQAKKEEKQLIEKLFNLNLVKKDAKIDEILGLNLRKLLDRRLQTQVLKRNLARTIKQARQFIVHRHIHIGDQIVNVPSYMVTKDEENTVSFNPLSTLSKDDHPERTIRKKEKGREIKPIRPTEKSEKPKEVKVEKVKEVEKPKEIPKKEPEKKKEGSKK